MELKTIIHKINSELISTFDINLLEFDDMANYALKFKNIELYELTSICKNIILLQYPLLDVNLDINRNVNEDTDTRVLWLQIHKFVAAIAVPELKVNINIPSVEILNIIRDSTAIMYADFKMVLSLAYLFSKREDEESKAITYAIGNCLVNVLKEKKRRVK